MGNDCFIVSDCLATLKAPLLDTVPSKACSTPTASFALVSKYGIPPLDLQNAVARLGVTILLVSPTSILLPRTTFVIREQGPSIPSQEHTYKREIVGISRAGLNKEFVPPAIQSIKALRIVHVVDQHTTVGASIKGYAQGLEPFLAGCVP